MNEGRIRPAVVLIFMNLFICTKPTPLSSTAGEDQAALLTLVKNSHMCSEFFRPVQPEKYSISFILFLMFLNDVAHLLIRCFNVSYYTNICFL